MLILAARLRCIKVSEKLSKERKWCIEATAPMLFDQLQHCLLRSKSERCLWFSRWFIVDGFLMFFVSFSPTAARSLFFDFKCSFMASLLKRYHYLLQNKRKIRVMPLISLSVRYFHSPCFCMCIIQIVSLISRVFIHDFNIHIILVYFSYFIVSLVHL